MVRFFPRTAGRSTSGRRRAGRRLASALLAVALGTAVLGTVPAGADDLKNKQNKVKKQIENAEEDLHSSSTRMTRATKRLNAARNELSSAQGVLAAANAKVGQAEERDRRMQAELEAAEADLARAEAALAQGRADMDTQQKQATATLTEYYQQGDPQLRAFAQLLESVSPADLVRSTQVRNVIVTREASSYQALLATKVLLDVHEEQVREAKVEVEKQREAAAAHLVEMEGLRRSAKEARDQVATLVAKRRDARAAAAKAKKADERALAQLEREEQRIADMLRKRALRRGSANRPTRTSGVLASPVRNGYMTSPYGMRKHPIYGYWGMHDGQDWGAGCGVPMYATESGRIASSYYSAVYGNRLVLDHGTLSGVGVASIYNHATHYTVGVGARVKRGQVIGYMGSTGWSTGCHLHFTVMVNGKTANPVNWL